MFTVRINKILSTIFPDIFEKMIETIGRTRMEKESEEEKIEIVPGILNELTSKKAFIFESKFTRYHHEQAYRYAQEESEEEASQQYDTCSEV